MVLNVNRNFRLIRDGEKRERERDHFTDLYAVRYKRSNNSHWPVVQRGQFRHSQTCTEWPNTPRNITFRAQQLLRDRVAHNIYILTNNTVDWMAHTQNGRYSFVFIWPCLLPPLPTRKARGINSLWIVSWISKWKPQLLFAEAGWVWQVN